VLPRAAAQGIDWEVCAQDESCTGVRLPTGDKCWAHAEQEQLDAALKQVAEEGRVDARGVPLTADLLERMLAVAPRDDQGRPVLSTVRFDQARFQGEAGFATASFQDEAWFTGATFQGEARFDLATGRTAPDRHSPGAGGAPAIFQRSSSGIQ
jgi:hypothetical protein